MWPEFISYLSHSLSLVLVSNLLLAVIVSQLTMVYVIAYLMIDVFKRAHEKRRKRKKKGRPCRFCVPYSWQADNTWVYISEEKKSGGHYKDRNINTIREKSIDYYRSIWRRLTYLVDLFRMLFMNVIVILIQHLMIWKMDVKSSFSLVHHRNKQVEIFGINHDDNLGFFSSLIESGLVLTSSTVVLTDERISHVGDPHAVETSCSYVELVDISSNAFSDWHEVYLFIHFLRSLIYLSRYHFFFRHYLMLNQLI